MTRNDLQPLIETIEAVAEAIRSAATSARPSRPWLGLQEIATDYVPLSERTLRQFIGHPITPYDLLLQSVGGMCHKLCQNPCATKYPAGQVLAQPNFTIQKSLFHTSIEQLCRQ
jgi:hypothetical protein